MRLFLFPGYDEHAQNTIRIVLTLFWIISASPIFCQEDNYSINNLTVDQGLSQNEVTSIIKDQTGFMWFATRGGLNRYDGKNFITFNSDPLDNNNIVNPSIERIYQAGDNKIWIGFKSGGLSSYDIVKGIFTNFYSPDKSNPVNRTCWGQRVIALLEDDQKQLWVGTWSDGLFIYKNEKFEHFLGKEQVGKILQTRDKRIWIGTSQGLFLYSKKEKKFDRVLLKGGREHIVGMVEDPDKPVIWMVGWTIGLCSYNYKTGFVEIFNPEHLSDFRGSYSIAIDSDKQIWVGTWGDGLYRFQQKDKIFQKVNIKPIYQKGKNIDYEIILDIYADKSGSIWIGTDGGGICQVNHKQLFHNLTYSPDGLQNTHIMCLQKDLKNILWIGTRGGGLFYTKDGEKIYQLSNPSLTSLILSFYQGSDGTFWIGHNKGIGVIEHKNNSLIYKTASEAFHSTAFERLNKVLCILEDNNTLWIGTQESGLYIFERKGNFYRLKKHFLAYPEIKGELKNERISVLLKDRKNNIWVGTYDGLHLFSKKDSSFIPVNNLIGEGGKLTSDIILHMTEDRDGNIWIATPNGLNKLTSKDGSYSISYYTSKNGLVNDYVHATVMDDYNHLWLSTNGGISKFDIKKESFINFGESDGLATPNFCESAAFKSKGLLYFGGINGVTWFDPSKIEGNKKIPDIELTSLSIFNHEVKIGEKINKRIILPVSLAETKEIELTYHEKEITISFAALNFISSGRNHYTYILEGYTKNWIYLGSRNFVSFNNLKPGEYIFRVKGSNNNNVWNNTGAKLIIKILPPPWKTWYAYIIYSILIVLTLFLVWSATFKRLQLEQKVEIEKLRVKQEQELNQMKIDFFTGISHEIRTPLTLILAPLQELLNKFSRSDETNSLHKLNLIHINAKKLLALINQLLDFRKIESNQMDIKVSPRIIDEMVENVCFPFKDLAESESKKFVIEFGNQEKELWYDENLMEIILNNLLSNAFKYCPENGTVKVNLYENDNHLVIDVTDTGAGIPADELDKIFNRFYQSKVNNAGGTGIGLFLVKQCVSMHKGSIEVNCDSNQTTFRLKFKKGKDHFLPEQIVQDQSTKIIKRDYSNTVRPRPNTTEKNLVYKILIIDDNKELRDYLEDIFGEFYTIITADNGIDGYQLIISENPDLVISDITMPKMDGLELCKRVKSNDHLKHIPFLLLTARNAEKYILLGTKYGADDYITKPFNYQILKNKVENLIATHVRLQNKYSQKLVLEPSHIEISNTEEKFLKKIVELIESNISNPEFNPGTLASKMNMSQSSLYRRLHAVTHQTVNEMIREIRIKRSAQLLADKEKNVSEIAYEVGFNDVKYFRNCFQKQYGKKPTEYRDELSRK